MTTSSDFSYPLRWISSGPPPLPVVPKSKTVVVNNVPKGAALNDVCNIFSRFGTIDSIVHNGISLMSNRTTVRAAAETVTIWGALFITFEAYHSAAYAARSKLYMARVPLEVFLVYCMQDEMEASHRVVRVTGIPQWWDQQRLEIEFALYGVVESFIYEDSVDGTKHGLMELPTQNAKTLTCISPSLSVDGGFLSITETSLPNLDHPDAEMPQSALDRRSWLRNCQKEAEERTLRRYEDLQPVFSNPDIEQGTTILKAIDKLKL